MLDSLCHWSVSLPDFLKKFFHSHSFPLSSSSSSSFFLFVPLFFPSSIHWQSLWNIGTAILLPCFPVAWKWLMQLAENAGLLFKNIVSYVFSLPLPRLFEVTAVCHGNDLVSWRNVTDSEKAREKWRSLWHAGALYTKFTNQKPRHYENCPFMLPLKGSDAHTQVCAQSVALKTIHQSFNSLENSNSTG